MNIDLKHEMAAWDARREQRKDWIVRLACIAVAVCLVAWIY